MTQIESNPPVGAAGPEKLPAWLGSGRLCPAGKDVTEWSIVTRLEAFVGEALSSADPQAGPIDEHPRRGGHYRGAPAP